MGSTAHVFFSLVDDTLDHTAEGIANRLLAELGDQAWTPEQRSLLQSNLRQELGIVVYHILQLFDNVGCVLPDSVDGWTIHSKTDGMNIRVGEADYTDMWLDHLSSRGRLPRWVTG